MLIRTLRQCGGPQAKAYAPETLVEAQVAIGGTARTKDGYFLSQVCYVPHIDLDALNEWASKLKEEHA